MGRRDESGAIRIREPLCAVFRRHLKAKGLKYTPERAQVLDAILSLEGIFEADQAIAQLRQRHHRVSKATVYRTIHLLQEAGIIQRVLSESDQGQYQLAYGRSPSVTLIRLDTRQATPVELPGLDAMVRALCEQMGLSSQGHRLQIFATAADASPPPEANGAAADRSRRATAG